MDVMTAYSDVHDRLMAELAEPDLSAEREAAILELSSEILARMAALRGDDGS
jgi:hypothetical protein